MSNHFRSNPTRSSLVRMTFAAALMASFALPALAQGTVPSAAAVPGTTVIAKDAVTKETMPKDAVTKETMPKEVVSKDHVAKEALPKEATSKAGASHAPMKDVHAKPGTPALKTN